MSSWIRITYHQRLFWGLVLYSLLLLGCFAVFQYNREKRFKAEELNLRLQSVNAYIIDNLDEVKRTGRVPGIFHSDIADLRISIIDSSGTIVYDNTLDNVTGTSHLSRTEIVEALRYGEAYTLRRHSESTGDTYFYSAKKSGDVLVRTAVPYSVSLYQLLSADYAFLWFMLGVTVVICLLGYFATHRLGMHVARLNDFAAKAERGERFFETEPFPHDELGDISSHIVRLYAQLQQALTERDREHRATLHEEQEKIRIKRQLTNNINHELKTPVASMKACLETLMSHEDMSPEKRKEFITRCYAANMRLQQLLDDVSVITRLEDGSGQISRTSVNVTALVRDLCAEYVPVASSVGMTISCHCAENLMIEGNAPLLSSVFRNLFDNAVAYSEGSLIELSVKRMDNGKIEFIFSDNGKGVDEANLPHLFERFYRVDKGRSRQKGGTGLGLSIVRNAIQWHGGTIGVTRNPSGGLSFTFVLEELLRESDSGR